ncbi:unnamed protein product [Linum trigynum]|uniref:Uncharacterized protein n=1 Tax=Linum trigynum TaxID=586398 RepID=A0AAV2EFH4_9ROSI
MVAFNAYLSFGTQGLYVLQTCLWLWHRILAQLVGDSFWKVSTSGASIVPTPHSTSILLASGDNLEEIVHLASVWSLLYKEPHTPGLLYNVCFRNFSIGRSIVLDGKLATILWINN